MANVAIISTFPPTQCGLATYTNDLVNALQAHTSNFSFTKIELEVENEILHHEKIVVKNNNAQEFYSLSEYINNSQINLVDLQHEFKIYGKPDGENVSILFQQIKKPIVTTLHTVSPLLSERRRELFQLVLERSDLLNVFSENAKSYLVEEYKVRESKIGVIPIGQPLIEFKKPSEVKKRKDFNADIVFISAGHLREAKGYDIAIRALGLVKEKIPSFYFLIVGADHPQNATSKLYREQLKNLANDQGIGDNVIFIKNYVSEANLIKFLQAADVGLLPYTRLEQSSSGILALMLDCGRPIVSTPFDYAKAYINNNVGVLSKSIEPVDFANAILEMASRRIYWDKISIHNHHLVNNWTWNKMAKSYLQSYKDLLANYIVTI